MAGQPGDRFTLQVDFQDGELLTDRFAKSRCGPMNLTGLQKAIACHQGLRGGGHGLRVPAC